MFRESYDEYLTKSNLCDWADVYVRISSALESNDELSLELKQHSFLVCNVSSNMVEVETDKTYCTLTLFYFGIISCSKSWCSCWALGRRARR